MQTILGAGGAIGKPLAKELKKYTNHVRLVARNPQKVNADDELVSADLLNANQVNNAVKGSKVVYLTVGLPYEFKIWKKQWPVVMQNCINACLKNNASLVFIDNVYMYDIAAIPKMTEDSPINPPSKKGTVRASLVKMLFDAVNNTGLKALIARSADFYGPGIKNGVLNIMVTDKFRKGAKANWQSSVSKIHSFTYTPDAAKATAMLGNTETAYGQVWHLPTSDERLTGKEFIALAAQEAKVAPKYFLYGSLLFSIGGLFSKMIRELKEMQYQNDRDYFFDSSKFNNAFQFKPTSYQEGIRATLEYEG